jgi:hypothetical protein
MLSRSAFPASGLIVSKRNLIRLLVILALRNTVLTILVHHFATGAFSLVHIAESWCVYHICNLLLLVALTPLALNSDRLFLALSLLNNGWSNVVPHSDIHRCSIR